MASLDALEREMLLDASLKKAPVAYALWFFLGGFGAHRFYLGALGGMAWPCGP
jgi:TM2 domain-containing membrane protein YozV